MTRRAVRAVLLAGLAVVVVSTACGKKGPPLPPLILLPNAPADLSAVRRADHVELTFRVPNGNTDRSNPADLARVEVYALTSDTATTADDVVVKGTRVATVAVNEPKDPDEPEPATPAPKGPGADQNEIVTISDVLSAEDDRTASRAYVAVGINNRNRRGPLSARLSVPLSVPPPAPSRPQITYDEKALAISWPVVDVDGSEPLAYVVYRPGEPAVVLTPTPLAEPSFTDTAIEWEKERCYEVRAVVAAERVRVESDASPTACVTPRDTFAPAAPQGLVGVGSEGAISLIWTANTDADLAGYVVLRAVAPATELTPVTPAPITDTNFRDTLPGGSRATYAVQAVDRAGNRSQPSATIAETAR